MNTVVTPSKPIEKMSKVELMRFVASFAPHRNFYPRLVNGGRVQAQRMYNEYLNNKSAK